MSKPDPNHDSYIPSLNAVNDELSRICDAIEAHFVFAGASINDALRASPWLPNAIKPPPRAPPPRHAMPAMPIGYLEACRHWISQHRALTAAAVAFVGTGVFVLWRRRRSPHIKRRARRARNGARTEVVVLAGSVYSPLTRSLALDLERKGFIVYIPFHDLAEERLVQALSRVDIRSLYLDLTSPSSTADTLDKFRAYLTHPNPPYIHQLRLVSLIILPASPPPTASIATLHPLTWSDTFTTHLVTPFTTIHAFFSLIAVHKASILLLTPSILPSLTPPLHALDNVTAGAMQSYISTLQKEVVPQGINVVHFKLGTFDYGHDTVDRALILRAAYDRMPDTDVKKKADGAGPPVAPNQEVSSKGSPLWELHNSVFDAIARGNNGNGNGRGRGGTVFVGQGSRTYDLVSRWVPPDLIGWILGFRAQQRYGYGYGIGASSSHMSAGWEREREREKMERERERETKQNVVSDSS